MDRKTVQRLLLPESVAILGHDHPMRELLDRAQRGELTERVLAEVVLHGVEPEQVLVTLLRELKLRVVVSLSGGKDSAGGRRDRQDVVDAREEERPGHGGGVLCPSAHGAGVVGTGRGTST